MYPKKFQEALDYLGPSYSVKVIDGVECIYRKISKFYDVEITGLYGSKKSWEALTYVWSLSPLVTMERLEAKNLQELELQLDEVNRKYRHRDSYQSC